MNTQEISFLAFLLERIRDEVLVIPRLLPVAVPVGSPFLDVAVGNRKEVIPKNIQLIGTNVWLPKMHRISPDVDFESSKSPAKSES